MIGTLDNQLVPTHSARHLHILISITNQRAEKTGYKTGLFSRSVLIAANGVSTDGVYATFHSLRPHPGGTLFLFRFQRG